jgi:hypothetical protein
VRKTHIGSESQTEDKIPPWFCFCTPRRCRKLTGMWSGDCTPLLNLRRSKVRRCGRSFASRTNDGEEDAAHVMYTSGNMK